MTISGFRGKYRFLSNFAPCTIIFDGETYGSVEHAYVASKTLDLDLRKQIRKIEKPGDVKKFGRKLVLRKDWDNVKFSLMQNFLEQKFSLGTEYRKLLDETKGSDIIEANNWHDNVWGVCSCLKCKNRYELNELSNNTNNNLGKLLMFIRDKENLIAICNNIFSQNEKYVEMQKNGKMLKEFFIEMFVKETKGTVNAKLLEQIIDDLLKV
jgi:ribA/ribD-fused uncharacterized protein